MAMVGRQDAGRHNTLDAHASSAAGVSSDPTCAAIDNTASEVQRVSEGASLRRKVRQQVEDEDDWGNEDLGDDLLPM